MSETASETTAIAAATPRQALDISTGIVDRDRPFLEAAAEFGDTPLRVRMPLLLARRVERGNGNTGVRYCTLKGTHWNVKCRGAAEALAVRDLIGTFFARLGEEGVERVAHRLRTDSAGATDGTDGR